MVRVDVHDGDPFEAELVPSRSSDDGAVVEDAEAVAGFAPGVVPGSAQQRMGRVPAGDDRIERCRADTALRSARSYECSSIGCSLRRRPPAGLRHLPHPLDVLLRVDAQDFLDAGLPGLEDRRRIVDTARPEQIPRPGDPRRRIDVDVIFDEPPTGRYRPARPLSWIANRHSSRPLMSPLAPLVLTGAWSRRHLQGRKVGCPVSHISEHPRVGIWTLTRR